MTRHRNYHNYYDDLASVIAPALVSFYQLHALQINLVFLVLLILSILSKPLRALIVWLLMFVIGFIAIWYGGIRLGMVGEVWFSEAMSKANTKEPGYAIPGIPVGILLAFGCIAFMIPFVPLIGGILIATRAAAWVLPHETTPKSGRPSIFTVLWIHLLSTVTCHWFFEWRQRRKLKKLAGGLMMSGNTALSKSDDQRFSEIQLSSEFDQILRLKDVGVLRGWIAQKRTEIRASQQQAADVALTRVLRARRQMLEEMLGAKRAADVLQDYVANRDLDQQIAREEKMAQLAEIRARRQKAEAEAHAFSLPAELAEPKPPIEEEGIDLARLALEGALRKSKSERAWKEWTQRIERDFKPWQSEQIIAAAQHEYENLPEDGY